MAEQWQLPEKFRITPELLEAADKQQERWAAAANLPFSVLSGKDRERANGVIVIREFAAYDRKTLLPNQKEELAEAYAAIGRFDEAYTTLKTSNPERAVDFLRIWGAVFRPDHVWCQCGEEHTYVERDIWSIKHEQERPLLRCNKCGCINVSTMPKRIEQQRELRRQAVKASRTR